MMLMFSGKKLRRKCLLGGNLVESNSGSARILLHEFRGWFAFLRRATKQAAAAASADDGSSHVIVFERTS